MNVKEKRRDLILPVLRRKFQNQFGGAFTFQDWLHCLYRRIFKTRFEICKDEDGELGDIRAMRRHSGGIIIPPRLMNDVTNITNKYSSTMWIEHEINNLLQKLDWWQNQNTMKKEDKPVSSQLLPPKQKQLQISRNRGR